MKGAGGQVVRRCVVEGVVVMFGWRDWASWRFGGRETAQDSPIAVDINKDKQAILA